MVTNRHNFRMFAIGMVLKNDLQPFKSASNAANMMGIGHSLYQRMLPKTPLPPAYHVSWKP